MSELPIEKLLRKHLPPTKGCSHGWERFNAPCCVHRGETVDKRNRGNIIFSTQNISFNCYNCQFKASWKYGSGIVGKNMRNLLSWLGASQDEIKTMAYDLKKLFPDDRATASAPKIKYVNFDFPDMDLPDGVNDFDHWLNQEPINEKFVDIVSYLHTRGSYLFELDNYRWSPSTEGNLSSRFIIPFKWEGRNVGYTTRTIDPKQKVRYINHKPKDYIFNTEAIKDDHKYILVTEGPMDALAVGGVAILGASISDRQAIWLNQQNKKIIIVPDKGKTGKNLISFACKQHWSVSYPKWPDDCKDAADACKKFGHAATVAQIIHGIQDSNILIEAGKTWF